MGREDKAPPLRMPPKKSLLTHHRPTAPDDPSSAEKPEDPSSVVEELKSPTPQPTLQAGDPSRLGGVKERMKEEAAPAPVLVPEVSAPPPEPAPEPVPAPSPEPEKVSDSQPVVPASTPRAQKPRKPEPVHSPALTQAMKRLQSQGPFTEKVAVSNTEASVAMAASTLPETMARLDLESRV